MRFSKRNLVAVIVMAALVVFLMSYQLPLYIYKPGGADALNPVVEVADGHKSEGDMHLVTIRGGPATPVSYLVAQIQPFHDIYPIEQVIPEGTTRDDYLHAQLQMMESSQQAATVVAYEAADAEIDIEYQGVFVVQAIEGMPADGKLQAGDKIIKINGTEIESSDQLIQNVSSMDAGTVISITVERNGKEVKEDIELELFPGSKEKVGVGIQLVNKRKVEVDPEIEFASGGIGGPSAGLMMSLEIYDQLTEEDITKGYEVAGTGEISYKGKVGRIGGIDKKVVAADREGCEIFFAPNEGGVTESNYSIAKQTAEEIGTDMRIVPVDTFEDALSYLRELKPKK